MRVASPIGHIYSIQWLDDSTSRRPGQFAHGDTVDWTSARRVFILPLYNEVSSEYDKPVPA